MKKHILLAVALVLFCVLTAGVVSAEETTVTTADDLKSAIESANAGDVIKLSQEEYVLVEGLKIDKKITLTAADPANKPKITVTLGQTSGSTNVGFFIAAAGVTLDNLSITSTGGSGNQNAVVFIQFAEGTETVSITNSTIITAAAAENTPVRGIEVSTQCTAPLKIVGNSIKNAESVISNGAAAIYINGRSGIQDTINYNIFGEHYAALVGYDETSGNTDPKAPDVRYNYWSAETIPEDAFPDAVTNFVPYYTRLTQDGKIDTAALGFPKVSVIPGSGETQYYDTIEAALAAANNGDRLEIAGEHTLESTLSITKAVTITARDPTNKPTITVQQIQIDAAYVMLENLSITQNTGTPETTYAIQVTADGTEGAITVKNSKIIPVANGRGFTMDTGAAFDLTFTGNTISAEGEAELAYAIYINGYDKEYVFTDNIIDTCTVSQFGFDQYADSLTTPVDIAKNYWGGEAPSLHAKPHAGKQQHFREDHLPASSGTQHGWGVRTS